MLKSFKSIGKLTQKNMKSFVLVAFYFLISLSYSQSSKFKTITIEPSKSFQNYEHFKRLVLNSPDSHIEYLEHFDFEWGYQYKIRVRETKLNQTLSDGTQYEYSFDKVISKTKVPDFTVFRLFLDADRYYYEVEPDEEEMNGTLHLLNDSTYLYFDEVEIEVPEELREQFKVIADGKAQRSGNFLFVNEKRIRLIGFN